VSFDWRKALRVEVVMHSGQAPTKRFFARQSWPVWAGEEMHRNPRFYKNLWQIWSRDDAPEHSKTFDAALNRWRQCWRDAPKLCTHDAMRWIKAYYDNRIVFAVMSYRLRRDDPALPWDFARLRARGAQLAPALDDDTDPEWFGHR
jgi:hypothetical protein